MSDRIKTYLNSIEKRRRFRRKAISVLAVLSLIVAIGVCWSLKLTGITMTAEPMCGKTAHTHTDECTVERLVCGYPEVVEAVTEPVLVCTNTDPEHQHDASCYEERTAVPHIHTAACYRTEYICGYEEHIHTVACYADMNADVEDYADWEATLPALSGNRAVDLVSIARSQLGYAESRDNFRVGDNNEQRHYSRYGEWYGNPYGDWNCMFAAFCLEYAGVSANEFPRAGGVDSWLVKLRSADLVSDSPLKIAVGDVAFADTDRDGKADRAGIVERREGSLIRVIEGDAAGIVARADYDLTDGSIVCFGDVPESGSAAAFRPETHETAPADTESAESGRTHTTFAALLGKAILHLGGADNTTANSGSAKTDGGQAVVSLIDKTLHSLKDASSEASAESGAVKTPATTVDSVLGSALLSFFHVDEDPAPVQISGESEVPVEEIPRLIDDTIQSLEGEEGITEDIVEGMTAFGAVLGDKNPGWWGDDVDNSDSPPDYIGTYPTGDGSTEWQITKYQYSGNASTDKVPWDGDDDDNPDVRIQKNVIPTGTENEFLVYLSIDKKLSWDRFLNKVDIGVSPTGKYKVTDIGRIVQEADLPANYTNIMDASGEGSGGMVTLNLSVYETQSSTTPIYTYSNQRHGTTLKCNNGTMFLHLAGMGYLIVSVRINMKTTDDHVDVRINLDELDTELSYYEIIFDSVVDELGDYVEYLGLEAYDGQRPTYDAATNTLTWIPADYSDNPHLTIAESPLRGWKENISQLVYRVRLRPDRAGFASCLDTMSSKQASISAGESYAVNNSAVLRYHWEDDPTYILDPATFVVPEVRGLRYDITFQKLDDEDQPLAGAVFGLFEDDGETPVLDGSGDPRTVTTGTGVNRFADLAAGYYVVKEMMAPTGYMAADVSSWEIPLSYTDDMEDSDLDTLEPDASPYDDNLRYIGLDDATAGQWLIYNEPVNFTYQLKVVKTDENGSVYLQNVGFEVTDPDDVDDTISAATNAQGVIQFSNEVFTPGIVYTLTETTPPTGYVGLPDSVQFKVEEDANGDPAAVLVNGDELMGLATLSLDQVGDTYVLTVTAKNRVGYQLPKTGGFGTAPFVIIGSIMIMIPLIYRYSRRHKRGRGSVG